MITPGLYAAEAIFSDHERISEKFKSSITRDRSLSLPRVCAVHSLVFANARGAINIPFWSLRVNSLPSTPVRRSKCIVLLKHFCIFDHENERGEGGDARTGTGRGRAVASARRSAT